MKRLPLTITFFASLFAILHLADGQMGTSVQCVNGECIASAGSSLLSIALGAIFVAAMLHIPKHPAVPTDGRVGFLRMVAAFYLDIVLLIPVLGAVLALPMLVAESFYTGTFSWSLVRSFVRPTDFPLTIAASLIFFAAVIYFRFRAMKNNAPSVGQYLMGYSVQSEHSMHIGAWLKRTAWGHGLPFRLAGVLAV